jgi:hypothetical protein
MQQNLTRYSFNLPFYLGENFVIVEITNNGKIDEIKFFDPTGVYLLFTFFYNSTTKNILNPHTIAYIESKINEEIN